MTINPEKCTARSPSIRQLAETMPSPEERTALLEITERYERLAQRANASSGADVTLRLPAAKSHTGDTPSQQDQYFESDTLASSRNKQE